MHAGLHEVHVEAGDLGVHDLGLHGCAGKENELLTPKQRCVRRTLAGNGAVESVSFDVDGLGRALSVGLEDVNCLDGVLDLTARVDRLDRKHRVHGHVGKELVVPASASLR